MPINDEQFDRILEKVRNRIRGFDFTDFQTLSEEVVINLTIATHISQIVFDDPFAFIPALMQKDVMKKSSKIFLEEMLNHFDSPKIKPMIDPLGLEEMVESLREGLKNA